VQAGDELPFVPRHQASAMAAVETSPGSLALAATHVSAMREHAGQGTEANEPKTDDSFILDVVARVKVGAAGEAYFTVRNLLGAQDLAARLPFGARPVAPRWIQVGTKWSF
jgi:Fe(3+) dicitrate transport protein